MKLKNPQLLILKIPTSYIKKTGRDVRTNFKEAINNDQIISLGSSQFSRALERSSIKKDTYDSIYNIGGQNVESQFSKKDRRKYQITNAIISVEIESENYYDVLFKKGFSVNDIPYVEYIGTTGGVKNSTVFYIRKDLYEWAIKRLNNGRRMSDEFIPSKLQAYQALDMSVSNPILQPRKFIVVEDCEVEFTDSVIELDVDENENPIEREIDNYPIKLMTNDGFGLISPKFAKMWAEDLGLDYTPSCFIVRNSYCKGALVVFDFVEYASKFNDNTYKIIDIWGNEQNVYTTDFILTGSMLKLWKSYDNIESYISSCEENDHQFCITKIQKEKNDEVRGLNYQFIQPLDLSDEDIEELCSPTLNNIKEIVNGGWEHKLLYLRGEGMNAENIDSYENDFIKAVMINPDMMYDPYVKNRINSMINKKMNEAKFGKLDVNGNFSILSGDPFALCQNIFGHEVTGLLKDGELYMQYWNEKNVDEIIALRAPMSSLNNIIKLKINKNEECEYWYKHMKGCSIINTWDTTTHTLNGADFDGDLLFTTNNKVFLRNVKKEKSIVCVQTSGEKKIPEHLHYHESNKSGFKNRIGSITNKGATMSDLKSLFSKDSDEYKELDKRIRCIQLYQQMEIDSLKGITVSEMPKFWYSKNIIDKEADKYMDENKKEKPIYSKNDLFNLSILAKDKPYFMIYIYDDLMKQYRGYIEKQETICANTFLKPLNQLLSSDNLSEEENKFIEEYYNYFPVSNHNGTMNNLCRHVEKQLMDIKLDNRKMSGFDISMLKTEKDYNSELFSKIKDIYLNYNKKIQKKTTSLNHDSAKNQKERKKELAGYIKVLNSNIKEECLEICSDEETMCNVLVDVCYTNNKSKNFVWDLCGNQIIENLLNNNDRTIYYISKDDSGSVEYLGETYSVFSKEV